MVEADAAGFRLTGWHVLASVCTFFAIVIGVDIAMATAAYRTFSGEVAKDPYEAGLLYNRTLAARKSQAELGWTASMTKGPLGDLTVAIASRSGQPVDHLAVSALLERPATETGRKTLALRPLGAGRYTVSPRDLSGAWDVRLHAQDADGHPFEAHDRFVWP